MPKKKTGQRKKAEKQKLRQKEIRSGKEMKPLADWACNSNMVRFFFQLDTVSYSLFTGFRNATDAIWSKSYELFVTFAPHFKDYQCVVIAEKWNACSKLETVLLSMGVSLRQGWPWWWVVSHSLLLIWQSPFHFNMFRVPSVIIAKPGSATVKSAWVCMVACVPSKKLSVLNARDQCGITVAGFSSAHSVPATYAKMINLSIKLLVRSLRQKLTNVSHAIDMASTVVWDVRLATVKTMSGVKDSSTKEASRCRARNAASRRTKPKIWACQVMLS